MNYYSIHFTLNPKLKGSNVYIKNYNIKIPNEKLFWEEPKFIGNINHEKIDFEPYLLDVELFSSSKINDLIIDTGPVTKKLIVSNRLKSILERYRATGMQFFKINIFKKNILFNDFWILNMHEVNMEFIDFEKTIFVVRKRKAGGTFLENINVNSIEDMHVMLKDENNYVQLFIERIVIRENISSDFFCLQYVEGGIKYIVSEKLKNEIEVEGCLGVEFMPVEMKMTEWLQGGEREKIYGKA